MSFSTLYDAYCDLDQDEQSLAIICHDGKPSKLVAKTAFKKGQLSLIP